MIPLVRKAKRVGLRLLFLKPSETHGAIKKYRNVFCGLTPLPLIVTYKLQVWIGPMVYTDGFSPSVIIASRVARTELCECKRLLVTSESIASYSLARILASVVCGGESVIIKRSLDPVSEARREDCILLIGDKGIRIYSSRKFHVVTDLASLYRKTFGFDPVFAATAGECSIIQDKLSKLKRLEPTLTDILGAYNTLHVPLPTVIEYLRYTRLDYNPELLRLNIALLQKYQHLIKPQPTTT